MDTYQAEALKRLDDSVRAAGEVVTTVSGWPDTMRHAKDCHIDGALENARRTREAIKQLRAAVA